MELSLGWKPVFPSKHEPIPMAPPASSLQKVSLLVESWPRDTHSMAGGSQVQAQQFLQVGSPMFA